MNFIANEKLRNQLVAGHSMRNKTWSDLLQTNSKGITINAAGALHYDDYTELTDDVVKVRQYDFIGNFYRTLTSGPGMSRTMDIGKTLIDYQDMNDFGDAETSMDMANRQTEQTNYDRALTPLPIFHKDFTVPWRQSGFSYKESDGVSEAGIQVMRTRDKTLMLGNSSIKVNGSELYGYTNHPATIKLPAGISNWADKANSALVYEEMVELITQLFLDARVGAPNSVEVFVSPDVKAAFQYKSSAAKSNDLTIEQDLKNIVQIRGIQAQEDLPAGAVLLVEMSPRTSDIAVASDVIAMPWQRLNQHEDLRFTIMAACTPRIKRDRNLKTGILYATK